MKLSKELLLKRAESGIRQDLIAKAIALSLPTYNLLEQGKYHHKLTPLTLSKLSAYLNVPSGKIIEMFEEDQKEVNK